MNGFRKAVLRSGKTCPELAKEYSIKYNKSYATSYNMLNRYYNKGAKQLRKGVITWANILNVSVEDLMNDE